MNQRRAAASSTSTFTLVTTSSLFLCHFWTNKAGTTSKVSFKRSFIELSNGYGFSMVRVITLAKIIKTICSVTYILSKFNWCIIFCWLKPLLLDLTISPWCISSKTICLWTMVIVLTFFFRKHSSVNKILSKSYFQILFRCISWPCMELVSTVLDLYF